MMESTAVPVETAMPIAETASSAVSARSSLHDAHITPNAALFPTSREDDEGEEETENDQDEEEKVDARSTTETTRTHSFTPEHVSQSASTATFPADPGTAATFEETIETPRSSTPGTSSSTIDESFPAHTAETTPPPVFLSTTTLHDPSLNRQSSPEASTVDCRQASTEDNHDHHKAIDSLVSTALSQSSISEESLVIEDTEDAMATPRVQGAKRHLRRVSSLDILQNKWPSTDDYSHKTLFDTASESPLMPMSAIELHTQREGWTRESTDLETETEYALKQRRRETNSTLDTIDMLEPGLDTPALTASRSSIDTTHRASGSSSEEELQSQVDWSVLDKNEEQEKEDKSIPQGAEDESTAFLLARLELENAKFALDPKASSAKSRPFARARAASRPPSMAHLKKLVAERDAPAIRYSLASDAGLPAELPPMTELEFWAALVQDYPSTAVRLPTLTTTKIRSGIPPPLRGVVWSSMAGARDRDLEDAFDKLVNEKSSYEGIINKDVGRSFPGVELFRDAEGDGQKMLGRVLKCFSLQDKDIGYCQGLGFLVGPLLMNMGEREAFCVLVRLMDHYSLRPSFLPSLSGLHMRIYQFSALLRQHHAKLHNHLTELGIEPAYLSQWFLSCFAVTCPLPLLFRIYDVIFAEGANETVMRVALALMRRHEERMLGTTEFEEVMQLLLGRELWDCYGSDADELVDDFTSLGEIVTFARLAELEKEFENKSSESVGQSAGFLPDVQAAAGRFLGRLWAPGHAAAPNKPAAVHGASPSVTTLSPQSAEKDAALAGGMNIFGRPTNFLRRSPSKQSIILPTDSAISEDGTSTTGSGTASLASTAPTDLDAQNSESSAALRESMADSMSMRSKAESIMPSHAREQQELHAQIEDLLMAIGEMQREHSQLAAMLQREREDRSEDHRTMRLIVSKLRKAEKDDRRKTLPVPPRKGDELEVPSKSRPLSVGSRDYIEAGSEPAKPKDDMEDLVEKVHERLQLNVRFSSSLETKAHLRTTLARTREQLAGAEAQTRELTANLESAEASVSAFQSESDDLRSEVKELRLRVADEYKARQKLEHQLQELRAQARSVDRKERLARESLNEAPAVLRGDGRPESRKSSMPAGGLRELRLGRRESSSSIQSLRASRTPPMLQTEMGLGNSRLADNTSPERTPSNTPPYRSTPDIVTTPPSAVEAPSAVLSKERRGFSKRTSSLATREVFATPEHESVPEEALLLELVNAKTAEAQARQEVDELRKALSVGRRKQDEALQSLRAEMDSAKADAARAWHAAETARAEIDTSRTGSLFGLPLTPFSEDVHGGSGRSTAVTTPGEEKLHGSSSAKKTETPPASTVGGWFWGRRTASQSVDPPPVVKESEQR